MKLMKHEAPQSVDTTVSVYKLFVTYELKKTITLFCI